MSNAYLGLCKTNENENSSLFSMHPFYADYFMKIGCFKSLKKSSKQSIFSKVTGLQGCRPVNLVKVAPFCWCFPRNLTKRCKLVILLIAPAKTLGHDESFSPTHQPAFMNDCRTISHTFYSPTYPVD